MMATVPACRRIARVTLLVNWRMPSCTISFFRSEGQTHAWASELARHQLEA
eukprot:CAMPEP_0202822244 /NCGR_PEP_ID=MMETSP1389-20130828/10936_1 /ASSEMBLY_ACC=CAM_ASM_000865 /TAXON_ID=302021 /ORGANISM="Rhodomonas sp., Strain CCMP768" /LENGTH=50 /DNA_ID=CAMNT_0049495135 /DNA_START=32 /DNA_END=180 /DNA_ORIENTATION=-